MLRLRLLNQWLNRLLRVEPKLIEWVGVTGGHALVD